MESIKFAHVRYRESNYGSHDKSGWFPVSGIYEIASSGSCIRPRHIDDFKKDHRYTVRQCTCNTPKPCDDMDVCEEFVCVRGFITMLGGKSTMD